MASYVWVVVVLTAAHFIPAAVVADASMLWVGSTTPATTTTPLTTPPAPSSGGGACRALTMEASSWIKLSSSLLSHPAGGRVWVRILFSTFSNGLLLRKFDWNNESISLAIVGGRLVLVMATGAARDISVASPYIGEALFLDFVGVNHPVFLWTKCDKNNE